MNGFAIGVTLKKKLEAEIGVLIDLAMMLELKVLLSKNYIFYFANLVNFISIKINLTRNKYGMHYDKC